MKIIKFFVTLILFFSFAGQGFAFSGISQDYNEKFKFHIFKIDLDKHAKKIHPYVVKDGLKTTRDVFFDNNFMLVVNGGFFDMKTGGAVSYVTQDYKTVSSPFENLNLIQNLASQNRLENVLNRAELRILENEITGDLKFDIDYHFAPIKKGYRIKHSLQAGPMIEPDLDLAKESFVVYDENSIPKAQYTDVLKRRPRTILALKDNNLYIIIFTDFSPVTIGEARRALAKYNFKKIMALDGGGSTSINYKDFEIYSTKGEPRELKSFLVIEK